MGTETVKGPTTKALSDKIKSSSSISRDATRYRPFDGDSSTRNDAMYFQRVNFNSCEKFSRYRHRRQWVFTTAFFYIWETYPNCLICHTFKVLKNDTKIEVTEGRTTLEREKKWAEKRRGERRLCVQYEDVTCTDTFFVQGAFGQMTSRAIGHYR